MFVEGVRRTGDAARGAGADYPRINEEIPDYNPRGCQKGACFVEYVYGAQRLKYPLIRTGARGEGKWRRATWDEALGLIAEKLVENVYRHGPDTNTFFSVIPAMSPVSFSAGTRLAHYLGGVVCSFYDGTATWPANDHLGRADESRVRRLFTRTSLWGIHQPDAHPDAHCTQAANGRKWSQRRLQQQRLHAINTSA